MTLETSEIEETLSKLGLKTVVKDDDWKSMYLQEGMTCKSQKTSLKRLRISATMRCRRHCRDLKISLLAS